MVTVSTRRVYIRLASAFPLQLLLLSDSEHCVTRLHRLNLTDSQQRDAVTYEPGQIVEFHRMARGAVRDGVQEKCFKSGEQWEVLRREEGADIIAKAVDRIEVFGPTGHGNLAQGFTRVYPEVYPGKGVLT
jgi:hypothetical protein